MIDRLYTPFIRTRKIDSKLAVLKCTVHPRLSEQVELKFLLGRSDTQKIRIIEEEHFTY